MLIQNCVLSLLFGIITIQSAQASTSYEVSKTVNLQPVVIDDVEEVFQINVNENGVGTMNGKPIGSFIRFTLSGLAKGGFCRARELVLSVVPTRGLKYPNEQHELTLHEVRSPVKEHVKEIDLGSFCAHGTNGRFNLSFRLNVHDWGGYESREWTYRIPTLSGVREIIVSLNKSSGWEYEVK